MFQTKLETNQRIKTIWESLAHNLPNNELCNLTFCQIVSKWVELRTYAFVNSTIQLIKRKINSVSAETKKKLEVKKSVPAMRKTLT